MQKNIYLSTNCSEVDWQNLADILKEVGMAYHSAEVHQRAFEASHTTVFIYESNKLIGFGRAISDGVYQGAIYDVAVLPNTQGLGIGKMILEHIMRQLKNCNLILYSTPGMEGFYEKLGFRKMTTGMAIFTNPLTMTHLTE